jgi:ubiquinone/menaquinone biosynthesis C-methylase UbiE
MINRLLLKLESIYLPRLKKTAYYENKWESRLIEDVKKYIPNQDRPSRYWLAKKIVASVNKYKMESPKILEIGCDLGANLYSLKKMLPDSCELVGIDISPASIKAAKNYMSELGASDIKFYEAKADDLEIFKDDYFDVVFTDAVLLYVADDKIQKALSEMSRVSKKMIFLLELSSENNSSKGIHTLDGWIRNYEILIKNNYDRCDIHIDKVDSKVRSAGRWPTQGELIKVISSNNFVPNKVD